MPLWRKFRVVFITLGVLIIASLAVGLGLRKSITLSIDGQPQSVSTYAFTVGDLLNDKGIPLSPSDQLSPALGAWLKNNTTIRLVHAIPIQILADGKITTIYSPERKGSTLIEQAGIMLNPGDLLLSGGKNVSVEQVFPLDTPSISLQLVRAVSFSLTENGKLKAITSTAPNLAAALWSAGYSLYASDLLDPDPTTLLTDGLSATLTHSRTVTIRTQAGIVSSRTAASTVGQALQAAHLSLQGLDYSLPSPDKPVPADGAIRLVRVTEQVSIEQTQLPYDTEFQPDSQLELDSQSILQAGEYGIRAKRVRIRYEDGVEASRNVESEWVARPPQTRIIGYGTSLVMHTITVDGVSIQYWRSLSMYATSYHPSEVGNITASGMPLKKGVVAVDTSLIPFYTQLYVPGYGEAVAGDIGGGVIGRWIDLGYSDDDYVPWHSWVTVYFLWPPPDNIVWMIP
ncbi:MAG TPA: ubiquitin-like domain-containing protein [Anaerolineales bacterium]|nr:ubiquitin-like domain-containing protein [Anaerolineales bacterium]